MRVYIVMEGIFDFLSEHDDLSSHAKLLLGDFGGKFEQDYFPLLASMPRLASTPIALSSAWFSSSDEIEAFSNSPTHILRNLSSRLSMREKELADAFEYLEWDGRAFAGRRKKRPEEKKFLELSPYLLAAFERPDPWIKLHQRGGKDFNHDILQLALLDVFVRLQGGRRSMTPVQAVHLSSEEFLHITSRPMVMKMNELALKWTEHLRHFRSAWRFIASAHEEGVAQYRAVGTINSLLAGIKTGRSMIQCGHSTTNICSASLGRLVLLRVSSILRKWHGQ